MSPPLPTSTPVIAGPTAGGKSSLALTLARHMRTLGIESRLISADAYQIYCGMDIGTAKPSPEERSEFPHELIDIVDPTESFSVSQWLTRADEAIAATRRAGQLPIVVGGTHLYIQSLLQGLFEGPEPDEALRDQLRLLSTQARREELQRVDPAAADRIHPNDERRTIRALEVYRQTGVPLSTLQTQWQADNPRPDLQLIILEVDPALLNRRINARVRAMIEQGLEAEVRDLLAADRLGPQAREALGYKQLIPCISGKTPILEGVERTKIETRRFAKNQRTWLRRLSRRPGTISVNAENPSETQLRPILEALGPDFAPGKA